MENILREKVRSLPDQASTIEVECRKCERPMVSRRRWEQLGRPADKVRHLAKGLCRTCYDRAQYDRKKDDSATLARAEKLLADEGLTLDDIERMVNSDGHCGQGQTTTSSTTTALHGDVHRQRSGPAQSARTPGRAVPRGRLI